MESEKLEQVMTDKMIQYFNSEAKLHIYTENEAKVKILEEADKYGLSFKEDWQKDYFLDKILKSIHTSQLRRSSLFYFFHYLKMSLFVIGSLIIIALLVIAVCTLLLVVWAYVAGYQSRLPTNSLIVQIAVVLFGPLLLKKMNRRFQILKLIKKPKELPVKVKLSENIPVIKKPKKGRSEIHRPTIIIKRLYKLAGLIIILSLIIFSVFQFYVKGNTRSAEKVFNEAFSYYLAGDCEKYSKLFYISLPDETDDILKQPLIDEIRSQRVDRCKDQIAKSDLLEIKIKNSTRDGYSDTVFIQSEATQLRDNNSHYSYPNSFVMKKINGGWMINDYYDPENIILIYRNIQNLLANENVDEAQEAVNEMTDDEYRVYKVLKNFKYQ